MKAEACHDERDVILDSINEGVFTVNLEWKITTFNRAAEQITGISRKDAIGRACCDVFHANTCEKACVLRRTFETGKPMVNGAAYIINQQGKTIPIRISTAILRNETGTIIGGVETFQNLSQIRQLQKELQSRYTFEDIVGRSPVMMRLFDLLPQIAESSSTVLIEGASGTGKELFARAIHDLSSRKKKRFVAVNCAALPDTLLESELFGHKAGAFTDARRDKIGRFVLANGGTIFLDEIGDISPALQIRLLRVLQNRIVEPLGAVEPVPVDIRIVAATNRNLSKLVEAGTFRQDLYYRIHVIHLVLPDLRQRREDIPLLADHFVAKFNHLQEKDITGFSAEAMTRLMTYDFPGNVRELENIVEQAFAFCRGGLIERDHLPPELRPKNRSIPESMGTMKLQDMEKMMITDLLIQNGGNRSLTAKSLGIDTSTLY
ncbi:MAG: sigma 54-interacting transcriptional regulator, partial [Desulfatirhabdiaceae bacterium]